MKIQVQKLHAPHQRNDIPGTPEERLNLVEQLRIQSGKFLYEYPTRLRRTIKVIRAE